MYRILRDDLNLLPIAAVVAVVPYHVGGCCMFVGSGSNAGDKFKKSSNAGDNQKCSLHTTRVALHLGTLFIVLT